MPTFVGRRPELDRLRDRAAEAGSSRPQTVVVEGSAGIGKSALLSAFAETLLPAQLLTASGDEDERFLPFGLLHQLTGGPLRSWDDPFVAGGELLELLDRRTAQPTVFVIDDAHLADSASMTALTFAFRRLRADKVLALVAALEDDIARIPRGLLRLADAQENRLRLSGLTDGDVVELGRSHGHPALSARTAARLRRHTGGNPLYLRALLEESADGALTSGSARLPAPQSFAHLVLGSLGALSPEAQALLRAAAVLADGSPMSVVVDVAEVEEVGDAFEELGRSSVARCRREEPGWTVAFLHPLVKAVVYDDLGPSARAELHGRAARRLDGEEALLHQVAAATGPDRELSAQLARCAEQMELDGQPHRAAELMLLAARTTEPGALADERLLDALNLSIIDGDIAAAKDLGADLPRLPSSARDFYLRSKVAWLGGRPGDAEELATAAWSRGEELDRDRRGSLAAILAQLCNMRGDGMAAADWAEQALSLDLPPDLADSTEAARALGLTLAGRVHDALQRLQDLPPGEEAVRSHGHRLVTRGVLRLATDDMAGARRDLTLVCDARSSEVRPHRLVAMGTLAELEFRAGRWDTSVALAEQAVSLAEDSEQVWVQGYLHCAAVLATAARGAWEDAARHLDQGWQLAATLADPATYAVCVNAGIHLATCRSESAEVVSLASTLVALGAGPTHEPGFLDWPVQYVGALTDLGRLDEAGAAIEGFAATARDRGSRSRLAALARVRGEIATAQRRHQVARTAFDEALRLGDGAAPALERALAHASYGRFLRRRGEKRTAVAQLQLARADLLAMGAAPHLRRCEDELAACGVGPTEPSAPTVVPLTPQEQMVAGLACRGMTSPEIARHLVLSVKTVSYHLANVYTKLDVHSRTQLASVWRERTA